MTGVWYAVKHRNDVVAAAFEVKAQALDWIAGRDCPAAFCVVPVRVDITYVCEHCSGTGEVKP